MQLLGIQLTLFAALLGAFGVAAGLALSGSLQNFTSGVLILLMKPFRVGDNIVAESMEGTVSMIRIFYTVVKTFDNRTVIIPNSKLSNEVIINLSKEGKRRLDIELQATLEKNTDLLKEPIARIGIDKILPDGYNVMINVWVNAHGFQDTKMQLQEMLVKDIVSAGMKPTDK